MYEDMNKIYISQDKAALEGDYKSGFPLLPSEPPNFKLADLHSDDSGRSWKDGVMDLNILRENVLSMDLVFTAITPQYMQEVLNAIKNKKEDGGFYASVFFPEVMDRVVMHMYRGDRDYTPHNYIGGARFDLKVSLIQL